MFEKESANRDNGREGERMRMSEGVRESRWTLRSDQLQQQPFSIGRCAGTHTTEREGLPPPPHKREREREMSHTRERFGGGSAMRRDTYERERKRLSLLVAPLPRPFLS